MNTQKERIEAFIKYKSLTNKGFEENCGLGNGFVSKIGDAIRLSKIELISNTYPELNVIWLKTGVGEMLQSKEREERTVTINQSSISDSAHKGALIYDIDATCGLNGRDIEFADERVVGSIDTPEINPDSKIIFATGDSMLPLIASGDKIVIRRIESWDYFNFGQVYLIITSEYRFIKRVRRHPKDDEKLILLRSENIEYDDIDLPKEEIIHLFIVENILSINNIL